MSSACSFSSSDSGDASPSDPHTMMPSTLASIRISILLAAPTLDLC
jgi:hypothetical protein